MKAVQISDTWRRLLKRPFNARYDRLRFREVKRIGSGTVEFKPGITALIGGNGVGKSTLMSTIACSMRTPQDPHIKALFNAEHIEVVGALACADGTVASTALQGDGVEVTPADATLPEHYSIDPSTYAGKIKHLILADRNFQEILEGVDPETYTDDERSTMSYIVGKEYASVQVYEVDEYAEQDAFPYFRVVANGAEYDSAQMGLGELSLFLIYWHLKRVKAESIVLIEEPETHVSPRSQQALINVCAVQSLKKALHIIVTTHSPFVIWRLPRDNVRLLLRNGADLRVVSSPSHDEIARILGDRLDYHGVVLVEDELSKTLLVSILRLSALELLEYYEIINAGSDDAIKQCLNTLPQLSNWFSLVGVFDGDQRGALHGQGFGWPHHFLPGDRSPEALLREVIEAQHEQLAHNWRVTAERLNIAREAAAGLEEHAWLIRVRQALGLDLFGFVHTVMQLWHEREDNKQSCEPLIAMLRDRAFLLKTPED